MLKIAICDDEKPVREYLKTLTEQFADVSVSTFEYGEDLLRDKTVFDIILLDISLKQNEETAINGLEVAKQIRAKSDAIIIFITALNKSGFRESWIWASKY